MRILIATLFVSVITLTGCGQKGPLYIEQDKGATPAPVTTPEETQEEDNKSSK